jgi:phosphatidylserine/phosphatidylglycerophosphate/cardiolipin synthase-like enzyme
MDVLSSTDISREVLALIEGAKQVLILVSPYFDPWERLTSEIKRAANRPGVKVVLLLRGGDDRAKQEEKARDLLASGVKIGFLSRLHAKVYISESQAIVTSMNLLKSSALDSWELAIRASAVQDAGLFKEIVHHTKGLLDRAKDEQEIAAKAKLTTQAGTLAEMVESVRPAELVTKTPPKFKATPNTKPPSSKAAAYGRERVRAGHCIRCGEDTPYNTDRPLCADCYKAWARYENPEYKEKHCHSCGKERSTSLAKPLCKPCWEAEE